MPRGIPGRVVSKSTSRRNSLKRKKQFVWDYRASMGCQHCGEKDPIVLEFHHVNPGDKNPRLNKRNPHVNTHMYRLGMEALEAEFKKCIVLCANCHRREEHRLRSNSAG